MQLFYLMLIMSYQPVAVAYFYRCQKIKCNFDGSVCCFLELITSSEFLQRPGAFAIYLEPWHADIFEFLDLKKNTGKEEIRARDLFYALWIPDLFMKRVEQNGDWTLMCPSECPGLSDTWGNEFEKLYEK